MPDQEPRPVSAHSGPALGDELQQLVDAWAARLRRSLALDDVDMNLVAASRHYGDEDPARVRAVLGRGLDDETVRYLLDSGVRSRTEPSWVPGVPELGLTTRLFVPVRCNGVALGFLCLIDPDESADEETVAAAVAAADEAGLVLYRRLVLHDRERTRDAALLRDLFATDASAGERAIREIDESHLLGAAEQVAVLVVRQREADSDLGRTTNALESALDKATRAERPATTLTMTAGRQGVVLVAMASSTEAVLTRVAATMVKELASGGPAQQRANEPIVGISGVVAGLTQAKVAYEQALSTARAAVLLPTIGTIARWDDLGIYAVLMRLPTEDLRAQVSTPAVRRLTERRDDGDLATTAETFLDCAGDTRRAAALLHIHRSTLYYRLGRIEELTGLDLRDGGDRLVLHLGLKAHRLIAAMIHPHDEDHQRRPHSC